MDNAEETQPILDPPSDEVWAEADVVCFTEGCENAGLLIRIMAVTTNTTVICGPCGNLIPTETIMWQNTNEETPG